MQLRWFVSLSSAGLMLLSHAPSAGAATLNAMEEPVTALVPPPNASPVPSAMHYDFTQNGSVVTVLTSTPLLCANTAAPQASGTTLNPVFYGGTAVGSSTPRPFVFGASASSPAVSVQAVGATNFEMNSGTTQFNGDDSGSLVCYGLDSTGAHRLTRDIFEDGADGVPYNSSVTLTVTHVPSSASDHYDYRIDVTLPALPVNTDEFALIEGFDSMVFATTASDSTSGIAGTWCQSFDGQTCAFAKNPGNINFSYANGLNSSLLAPVAPNAPVQYHFLVQRYLHTGVAALPTTGAPLVIAALFSPNDLQENKLDDNVASGSNLVSNLAPSVTQDATFTSFAGSLAGLNENTDSSMLTFDISDPDTADVPGGGSLHALVSLTVGGLSTSVSPDCSTTLPANNGSMHACKVDIALNNGNFWNSDVSAPYDGLFNALATDSTNGVYAPGVTASLQITAIDALGKASAPLSVPVHIHSTANNAPVMSYTGAFAAATDPNNNQSYSTYSCSVGVGTAAGGCGTGRSTIEVDLSQVVVGQPGPAASFDELASQTTAVVPFSDPNDAYTNVQCTKEQAGVVFAPGGGPIVTPTSGIPGQYDMNYLVSTTPPASAVSALCTLMITDVGPFPNGETAKTTSKQFRIVVNP